jgi:hypothetical protein
MISFNFSHLLRSHWYFLIAPLILACNVFAAFDSRGEITLLLEAGIIADLAIVMPFLFWVCYRGRGRKTILQALALCCSGIWIASKLVLESEQQLLQFFAPLRYLGLAFLIYLEFVILFALYKAAFQGRSEKEVSELGKETADLPPWIGKLLVKEIRFYKNVWTWIRAKFK